MLYICSAKRNNVFCFALHLLLLLSGKAFQAANATSNGGDASRVGHKDKGSQTALITLLSVSPCHKFPHKTGLLKNAPTRDASPPLEVAFAA